MWSNFVLLLLLSSFSSSKESLSDWGVRTSDFSKKVSIRREFINRWQKKNWGESTLRRAMLTKKLPPQSQNEFCLSMKRKIPSRREQIINLTKEIKFTNRARVISNRARVWARSSRRLILSSAFCFQDFCFCSNEIEFAMLMTGCHSISCCHKAAWNETEKMPKKRDTNALRHIIKVSSSSSSFYFDLFE